jgi:glycosyltransferase involved in cell wall biosynthesis
MQTLLYITYSDFNHVSSGSSVRPYKLYQAFKDLPLNISLISGYANRKLQITNAIHLFKEKKFDFCYIEPPSEMIFSKQDWKLFKSLKKYNIPVAFFFRDFFYKFPINMFYKDLSPFEKMKIKVKQQIQKRTEKRLAKYIDIFYFPSPEAAKIFKYPNKKVLPPAGESLFKNFKQSRRYTLEKNTSSNAIYVGGISKGYGTDFLINAFKQLNQNKIHCKLIFVCRKAEFENSALKDHNFSWLNIVHAQGDDLVKLYQKADIALLPINSNNPYHNKAVSVKLFEYMSYALPIVSTPAASMAKIIKQYDIGFVTKSYSEQEFSQAILKVITNSKIYTKYQNNIISAIEKENLWIHRAKQIINDLNDISINLQ